MKTRSDVRLMLAMVVGSLVLTPTSGRAQEMALPADRPIVYPAPASKSAIGEAEHQLKDLEAIQRERQLLREQQLLNAGAPSILQHPNLGQDVTSGIQRGAIQNVQPR